MNGNANGSRHLKRMELVYRDHSYLFTVNPESYEEKIPNRMNLVYTKAGAFVDLFGQGIREISLSGTTGFRSGTKDNEHGYEQILSLKKLMEENFKDIDDGKEVEEFLIFYNHTDGEAYVTVPGQIRIYRNVSQPLLYKYDLSLYAIRKLTDSAPSEEIQQIGNPFSLPQTGVETVKDRDLVEKDGHSAFTTSNRKYLDSSLGKLSAAYLMQE